MSVYRDWASRKRVDGVILVDLRADDPRPKLLKELGVRAVLAGGPDPNNYVPSLSIDDSRTMGTVLEHLSSLGHRRIAYLSGDSNLDYSQGRVSAFRSFAKRRKLESINIEFTNFDAEQAAMLTLEMLRSPKPPTAFIYETEILAAASLHAMAEAYTTGQLKTGEGQSAGYPNGLPLLSALKTALFVRQRTRRLPQRIVTPVNTVQSGETAAQSARRRTGERQPSNPHPETGGQGQHGQTL